jgi:signal transduction histidine kinase
MFRGLNARLLLSYILIVLVCLGLVAAGLFLFVRTSPLWSRVGVEPLDPAVQALRAQLASTGAPEARTVESLRILLARICQDQEVRALLLDQSGRAVFDSEGVWTGRPLADLVVQRIVRPTTSQGTFVAPDGRRWIFFSEPIAISGGRDLFAVFIAPYARWLPFLWFVDNFFPPLLRAGLVALVLSVLMAWLLARSVARPLRRVAGTANALAQGDLAQRAPVSGPKEVRDVAQAFNHMADEVTTVQQSQRDLIANVSHELKTPLTSIQGFSQAILDGTASDPASVERAATIISDEAERMRRMVTALLDLARFDAGQVKIARGPVDLSSLVKRCAERLTPQAEAAGNALVLSVPDGFVVTGDPDWLTQVFVNLIDNAICHTHDGRVEVTAEYEGESVRVTVTDTGEGIPPEDLSRIFERFYRADKSRRRQTGAGLGLSIAREVVRLHGGNIVAESLVGLGSRFTVQLPARKNDQTTA